MGMAVAVIGGLVGVFALLGVLNPAAVLDALEKAKSSPTTIYVGATIRLLVGVFFLVAGPSTSAPDFVRIVGVLAIIGGLIGWFLGPKGIARWIDWFRALSVPVIRAVLLIAAAVGALLVWAGI